MTEVFSTFDVKSDMMTIITMRWDILPIESNRPSPPSRPYFTLDLRSVGGKKDGPNDG